MWFSSYTYCSIIINISTVDGKMSVSHVSYVTITRTASAVFRAPQHPQLRGGGAQTLEGAAREWEKLKRAIPGYETDVFVMLELKTKLLFCFFQFQLLVYEKLQFTPC